MTITNIIIRMIKTSSISVLIVVCLAAQVDMAPVKTTTTSTSTPNDVEERAVKTTTTSTSTPNDVEERAITSIRKFSTSSYSIPVQRQM